MKPVKDSDGFILNTGVLRVGQVTRKKVVCPACGEKAFVKWPYGWDGHAERCKGLETTGHANRKVEFKAAFSRLFLR